jgi:hypothetical protein
MTIQSTVRANWRLLPYWYEHARNVLHALLSRQITFRSAFFAWRFPLYVKALPLRLRRGMLVVCPDLIEEMFQMDCGSQRYGVWDRGRELAAESADVGSSTSNDAGLYDVGVLIKAAEKEAAIGCGQSDVLYELRVQGAYERILLNAPTEQRQVTEAVLRTRGYDPDFVAYEAQEGECSLTGIDEDCCPCGRHP